MSTSTSNGQLSPKRSFPINSLLYGGAIVPVLVGTIFHDEAIVVAGAIASIAMLTAWAFKTGVRKFFCALLLFVVGVLCVAEVIVLWRRL